MSKATMYLRGMREEIVREAKAMAAREGVTLTRFVERALERETRSSRFAPSRISEIARDMDWYEANKPRLLKRHEGQYLAIIDGGVVDHDRDLDSLAARVHKRFGLRSVFMPLCQRSPRTVQVRSPRVAR